jgi:hypothetical protein
MSMYIHTKTRNRSGKLSLITTDPCQLLSSLTGPTKVPSWTSKAYRVYICMCGLDCGVLWGAWEIGTRQELLVGVRLRVPVFWSGSLFISDYKPSCYINM